MAGFRPANNGNRSTNRVGATVSRRLRAADWNVSPSARKHMHHGMFVTGMGDYVSVMMDFGIDAKNERVAAGVLQTVSTWAQVSGAEITSDDGVFWVRFSYGRTA